MNRKIGVVLSYVLMIFEVLSTLLLTPFIIRTLGQSEYGVYKLSAAITAYILLLDLGVGNAVTRFVAKYRVNGEEEQNRRFFGVSLVYYGGIAVLSLLIGLIMVAIFPTVFAKGLSPEETMLGEKLLGITMLNAAVTLGTAAFPNILIAYERFAFSRLCSIAQIILRMGMTLIALKLGMGSMGIVLINLVLTIFLRLIFAGYTFFVLKLYPTLRGVHKDFIKEIIAYSSWILLQMIATQINAYADQVLIGALVSASAVILAVYSVGTQIVQYFQSLGSAFNGVLMPGIVSLVEKGASSKRLCEEMIRIGRIILLFLELVFIGFFAFGRQFMELWAGTDYSDAYYVACILMPAYLLILTESIGTQILWAMNAHRQQAVLKLCTVLINIVLTVFLIKWKPLIGATIGTAFSLFISDVVVMNIVFSKQIGISLRQYYGGLLKGLLPAGCATLLCGYGVRLLHLQGWIGFLINVLLLCGIYAVVMWFVGMNTYEKHLLASLFRKLTRRNYKEAPNK